MLFQELFALPLGLLGLLQEPLVLFQALLEWLSLFLSLSWL